MIYVGQTDSVKRRIPEHLGDSTHLMYRYGPVSVVGEIWWSESLRRSREAELIAEYDPPANRAAPPVQLISPSLIRLLGLG